jgi:putative NADH-flavin reductase
MRKMIVFGAAGGTGIEVVRQALQLGYRITAVVRHPDTFTLTHPNLTIVKGDVMLAGTIGEAIAGHDIVISAIGNRNTQPTVLYSCGIKNMLDAMAPAGIKRLICISAGGLDVNPKASFFVRLLTKYVLQRILREPYADLRRMEALVRQSGTDYTILRPARLLDKPLTGKYRAGIDADLVKPFSIARADVAHFIVTHLDDKKTVKTVVSLSY